MAKIAVIGTGYVGSVSGACLADFGNHVICVDTDNEKIEALKKGIIPIYEPGLDAVVARNIACGRLSFSTDIAFAAKESDIIFIAVSTPPADDGSADLAYVETAARQIGSLIEKYTVIVNKSTVPVGTARKVISWVSDEITKRGLSTEFDVVSNPEFLREGTAVYDSTHPDRVVIGSESERARNIMKDVYRSLYLNETPYIETNLESAEMIKYASNAFLAVKITFINEISNLCEKTGADIRAVAKAMGKDGRIGSKFLHPGPGYGGSCFPKDTRAIAKIGRNNDEILHIVEAAIEANENQKLRAAKKIESVLGSLSGKTIALLGLSFKPNTDDMRESPAITICEYLANRGAHLRLYDPAAMKSAQWRLKALEKSAYYAVDEYDAANSADALVIVTEWNQFRNLDLYKVKELLASPYFFDLRNIYKKQEAVAGGLKYFGIGNSDK
ncbi:MAG: UDP-glucose/GDP-mannose dehydrogenase family protein [Treponema sp.]|jgi:UDPglucose 6-dehydrogenase|nr:UDP-glucose/GDP-mannose dehydrogenase family protein [Treponema sp.]